MNERAQDIVDKLSPVEIAERLITVEEENSKLTAEILSLGSKLAKVDKFMEIMVNGAYREGTKDTLIQCNKSMAQITKQGSVSGGLELATRIKNAFGSITVVYAEFINKDMKIVTTPNAFQKWLEDGEPS